MRIKFPEDDERTRWTRHIKNKMLFYGLSEARIRRVLSRPDRKQEGVAELTIAVMQRVKTKKKPEEIWVMYRKLIDDESKVIRYKSRAKLLMISAWRYPGVTKPGSPVPVPDDVWEELAA